MFMPRKMASPAAQSHSMYGPVRAWISASPVARRQNFSAPLTGPRHDVRRIDVGWNEVREFGLFHPRRDQPVRPLDGGRMNLSNLGTVQGRKLHRDPHTSEVDAVGQWVGHHSKNGACGVAQRNVHGKARPAFQKRLGAVQRVHQPKPCPLDRSEYAGAAASSLRMGRSRGPKMS